MVAAIRVHDFAPGPNGCTLCGLERRNTAHWSEPIAEPVFTSPILNGIKFGCEQCDDIVRTGIADGQCHKHADGSWSCREGHEPVAGVFTSPIPGGTFCELCGRLRHTHVDDRCVSKPVRSRAKRDESTEAQLAYALQCLASLVRHFRKVSGYAVPEDQDALREAEALLVEVKG